MVLGWLGVDPKKGVVSSYVDSEAMSSESMQWVAVTVLVFRGEHLLTMQRAADAAAGPGVWEGVSGRVRPDEDPLDAARRELLEETSLEAAVRPRPVDVYAASRRGEPMTVIVFAADHRRGEVVLSQEHDAFQWVALAELSALGVPPRLIEAARRAHDD